LQEEPFLLGLLFVLIYCVVTVLGLVVALIAWAGARAGIVVGALILLVGLANLVYTLLTSKRVKANRLFSTGPQGFSEIGRSTAIQWLNRRS
jgi:hypothetical protein